MTISRRTLAGALIAAPLVAGMRRFRHKALNLGVQTYSYRDMLSTPGDMVEKMIAANHELGLSTIELWDSSIQPPAFAEGAVWYVPPGGEASAASVAGTAPEMSAAAARSARRERIREWRMATPLSRFAAIGQRFRRSAIQVAAYSSDLKDDFSDAEVDRIFLIARALGAPVLTTSTTLSMAERLVPVAGRHRMRVAMHNHSNLRDPNEIATPESFERCLAMSPFYAANLDLGHFSAAGFDAAQFLELHHKRTASIHLKDRKNFDGPNVPFGDGDTPVKQIVRLICERGWPIPLFLEYEYAGGASLRALRASRDYVRAALR